MFNVEFNLRRNQYIHALHAYIYCVHTWTRTNPHTHKAIVQSVVATVCYIGEKIQLDEHLSKFKINSMCKLEKESDIPIHWRNTKIKIYTRSPNGIHEHELWLWFVLENHSHAHMQTLCTQIRINTHILLLVWWRDWELYIYFFLYRHSVVNVTYKLCERQNHKTYISNSHS